MSGPEDDFLQERALARAKVRRLAPAVTGETSRPAAPASPAPAPMRMVDVGGKPPARREATAEGFLRLRPETVRALREGRGPKGDPFPAAQVAGVLAAKRTPEWIPFCHPLPLTGADVALRLEEAGVRARATVRVDGRTGVEMEALCAVSAALLTVWDMTKQLEKDAQGQYPHTSLEGVRIVDKRKEPFP